jgi:hypothetical protein
MTGLERRCRWLLRGYPASYRADRGDEILGTLLEASAPDRSWPAARDTRALILGGLRVRAWQHQRQTTASALRQAVLLAAVLDLAHWSSQGLGSSRAEWGYTSPSMSFAWLTLMLGLLTLAAMAGAWFGRRVVVVGLALAAAGLWVYQPPGSRLYEAAEPVLALAVVAVLVVLRERLPRSWLWFAAAWYLLYVLPEMFQASQTVYDVTLWVLPGMVVGAIGWSVIDARLMLATAVSIAAFYGDAAIRFYANSSSPGFPWDLWPWLLQPVLGIALAAVAVWRVRRQAVL